MFAEVRHYSYDPQYVTEIQHLVREGFAPKLRELPGFVAYYWIETGAGTGASWTVFEDKASADAGLDRVSDFAQAVGAGFVERPRMTQGHVIAFTNAGL